ncbi:MerR family transcriptional regulator [Clostridium sp. WLY-B-L2]|jgi:DNA-binding transcriptional MerR regulator|uniref:MerR family transcriptional regulator n=1 Tax=Clostridium aromativorans TaxID=2836848 RepID=A0ABS8N7N4_9CLOT|nr:MULTISPECIES: MerR family transcriptional regulator [Clostridium]KAA8677579.1 MerR family transcriptional regulator [Clostridium sp. HV4-5-A1G]MCC9295821.1 MerR family transcriptional regulator [Clostridium aromativorans]CAB1246748.1 HTH-type transcriptional activator mta [Clostridiaceae bacterium BL-3]
MEYYTVQGLSKLSGVSKRAIRYYDEIGILKPARINSSGYRIYGQMEVDRLQQILFYKELGVNLEDIKNIVTSTSFDTVKALKKHHEKLLEKRRKLDLIISNVEKTIAFREGRIKMTDSEKFEGFKERLIEGNEKKYGREIREKYGDDTVERSNEKFRNMTENQYREAEKLQSDIMDTLESAFETKNPGGELAQKAADMHRRWLSYFWDSYSKEAHVGVAQMYVDDRRFTAYYDKRKPGMAKFLRDAIFIYTGMKK